MDLPPSGPPPAVPPLHESAIAPELPEVPWQARDALAVAFLGILTGLFFSLLVATRFKKGDPTLQLLVEILLEGSLAVWVVLWVKLRFGVGLKRLGVRFTFGDVGTGVLAGMLGLAVSAVITEIVLAIGHRFAHHRIHTPKQLPTIDHNYQWALAFFAVVIVAPIAEELFFRGMLYQAYRRWRGVNQAVVLSAVVFGLAHLTPVIIPAIFALGLILAYAFENRGSLATNVTAHMVYNFVGLVGLYASAHH